jgi:hypothetical protein
VKASLAGSIISEGTPCDQGAIRSGVTPSHQVPSSDHLESYFAFVNSPILARTEWDGLGSSYTSINCTICTERDNQRVRKVMVSSWNNLSSQCKKLLFIPRNYNELLGPEKLPNSPESPRRWLVSGEIENADLTHSK